MFYKNFSTCTFIMPCTSIRNTRVPTRPEEDQQFEVELVSERFSCEESAIFFANLAQITQVLIFCVEFWELSHLTCDEKKMNVVKSWTNAQNDIYFTQVVILSVAQLVATVFFSQLEISHVVSRTTPKTQHRKWARDIGQKMLNLSTYFNKW